MTAATSASFMQTTGTKGSPISGYFITLVPTYAHAFAVLYTGGSDEGSRVEFFGFKTNQIPPLTPASTGSYTIRVYDSMTGGNLILETGAITVSGPQAPAIGSGAAPTMMLDASAASTVTSDSGYATPQTTNGGVVEGWKDGTTSGFNFNQTSSGNAPTLVTASQNGLNGIKFAEGSSQELGGLTAFNTALHSGITSTGCTFAVVFKVDSTSSTPEIFTANPGGNPFVDIDVRSGNITLTYSNSTSGTQYQATGGPVAANTLMKCIVTFDGAGTMNVMVNGSAAGTSSYSHIDTGAFTNPPQLGYVNGYAGSTNVTLYEMDFWPVGASGTGGAQPNGDIATIMQYLTAKWAS